MNRCRLAIISGLILSSAFAAIARGQAPQRQPTLAERMAALRRGWGIGSRQTPAADKSLSIPDPANVPNSSATTRSRSLLPDVFHRGSAQSSSNRATTPNSHNAAAQMAARPRAGSAQAAPSGEYFDDNSTLPGLGGSRLPTSAQGTPPGAAGAVTRELASDYPVIRDESSAASNSYTDRGSTRTAQANPSQARRSPQHRAPMHVGPNDLQRDLVGAFPTEPTEPTGQSPTTSPIVVSDSGSSGEQMESSSAPRDGAPTEMAIDHADDVGDWVTDDGTDGNSTRPSNSDAAPTTQPRLNRAGPTATAAPRTNPSPSRSIDLRPAFGRNLSSAPVGAHPSVTTLTPIDDRHREVFGESADSSSSDEPGLLVSQQTPLIATDIRGPRQILVDREATYRVRLENKGTVPAEGIIASIRIPSWADVVNTSTTQGTIQQSPGGGSPGLIEWQIVRLEPESSETADIRLVPRASRPLELGVSYTVAPVGSRAIVEVQEPKLGISVSGPDDVLFGKPQIFRLTITNPGTGTAENVKIDLRPPGGDNATVSSHALGDLAAGTSKTVEVELTAREPGKLSVKAQATADGGLSADAEKDIFCRKPELQVDWRGPAEQYAGTRATYYFRVRNPGTAPAEDVTVRVVLPEGAEFTSASEGQSLDTERRTVSWRVGTLGPGDDYYMELKCLMQTPGANQLNVTAVSAAGDLTDSELAETKVVALADLKLEVSDPSGPVAVGAEALYEIRVINRGANAAQDVNIVALFSEGIEPDQVEGGLYSVADGRVSFRPIDELAAGRQMSFRIRAHALQPGTHVFRAEVLCRDLEIKLAAEETTRFYANDLSGDNTPEQQAAERTLQFKDTSVR